MPIWFQLLELLTLNQLAQFHLLHALQVITQTLMEIVFQMSAFQQSYLMENKLANLVLFQMETVDV
jgi:hypothetical protein